MAKRKHSSKRGQLTVLYGPMFSGKTSRIIATFLVMSEQKKRCVIVKPSLDTRYGTDAVVHNHDGRRETAFIIDRQKPELLLSHINGADVVIIDEIQFFPFEQMQSVIETLRQSGVQVIVAGLLYDFRRVPFDTTSRLLGLADEAVELTSVCQTCGAVARHSQRIAGSTKQIDVGEKDKYQAVCEHCHVLYEPNG